MSVTPQPAFVFAGHQFDADPQLRLCKSMLLDLFRGRIVESINLKVSSMYRTPVQAPMLQINCDAMIRQHRLVHGTDSALVQHIPLQSLICCLSLNANFTTASQ